MGRAGDSAGWDYGQAAAESLSFGITCGVQRKGLRSCLRGACRLSLPCFMLWQLLASLLAQPCSEQVAMKLWMGPTV